MTDTCIVNKYEEQAGVTGNTLITQIESNFNAANNRSTSALNSKAAIAFLAFVSGCVSIISRRTYENALSAVVVEKIVGNALGTAGDGRQY